MEEGEKKRYRGRLNMYVNWPLILSALVLCMTGVAFAFSCRAGLVSLVFAAVYIAAALSIRLLNKRVILNDMINFATRYGQVQKQLLKGLAVPYALLDESGRFIWCNAEFQELAGKAPVFGKSVTSVIPALTKGKLPEQDETASETFSLDDRDFRADMRKIPLKEITHDSLILSPGEFSGELITLFLFDETEICHYKRLNEQQRLVCGYIYMDNYDEAMENVEEVRRSLLSALIDRRIKKYFSMYDAVVRSFEKDKYYVTMKKEAFERMLANRCDILEDVKTVRVGNEMSVTLSMGFGLGTESLIEDAQYARNAIDLALGRGGDQMVVKTPEKTTYFGGKSQKVEKSTRVKARVKAHALREIIESKDRVFVMGHQITDIDTFGSAIGIYRATVQMEKKCHIVINDVTVSIRPFYEAFVNNQEYDPDMFVTNSEALQLADQNAALVVVDTNKPSLTECPDLLSRCKSIVVLDHHRQGSEIIENATLSYIEPYASSACEMVAEILQYISENIRIKGIEADSLYAGIVIDTNNFMTKAGVRTFEAAAFLRRNGADITRVRKLFRNEFEDFRARAETVKGAELFLGKYALSICPGYGLNSPTVVGAQAANELLNISAVRASFVLTEYQSRIYISARSIDEVNVQLVMERLGGGGHMNIAGAQLTDMTAAEAMDMLKNTLQNMEEEGQI